MRAVVRQAYEAGHDELAFDLAQRIEKHADVRSMYAESKTVNRRVPTACRRAGNVRARR